MEVAGLQVDQQRQLSAEATLDEGLQKSRVLEEIKHNLLSA